MKITVLDKRGARMYRPHASAAIIRISDSLHLPKLEGEYVFSIRFTFSDVDEGPYVITDKEAQQIAQFIRQAGEAEISELVVHCDYGMGRSPAVALAASKYFQTSFDEKKFPALNRLVLEKVSQALDLTDSPT